MTTLAASRWPELGTPDVVLVPLGSTEQHGPHLPLTTDTAIATAVADQLAEQITQESFSVVVAPAIPVGASGEHQDFPGTISMGQEALHHVLIELARSIKTWSPRLIFVNGHGGNAPVVAESVKQLTAEEHRVMWVSCGIPGQDAHAGREETSIMLYLAPETATMDFAEAGNTSDIAELLPQLQASGVRALSPNGVLGDPAGAHAAEGKELLEKMTSRVVGAVLQFMREQP